MPPHDLLPPPAGPDEPVRSSVARARAFLLRQATTRTPFRAARLVPDDTALDRHAAGTWSGRFELAEPDRPPPAAPYTPVLLRGPLHFPIAAHRPVTFDGAVDFPFVGLEGLGAAWPAYHVVGSVRGVRQFAARVAANGGFRAALVSPPPGPWSFQLVAYPSDAEAAADRGAVRVGAAWNEEERPGDVRAAYGQRRPAEAPLIADVARAPFGAGTAVSGRLAEFARDPARRYALLVTGEADTEYGWALVEGAPGPFRIERDRPLPGALRLRLVELENGWPCRVLGQVWAEENARAGDEVWPELRLEVRAIAATVPAQPTAAQPARRDGRWQVTLRPPAVGRVSLVDVGSRRVLGEHTVPSGLLRSFNVPAELAGQTPDDVYWDGFNDACFLYDQAVALIAFLQLGERPAAARLVDALLAVQNPDGGFPFACDQAVLGAHDSGFIRIGAVAWVGYALLVADRPEFRPWFAMRTTAAARRCLDFLQGYANPLGLLNGGKGRYVGHVLEPDHVVPWWSTEHNIDAWWAFDLAAELYGEARHRQAADRIRAGLESAAWNARAGIFWQGGTWAAGRNQPDGQHALDVMSWGSVLLERWGRSADRQAALERMQRHYWVTDAASGLSGFTTFVPGDGYPVGTVTSPWYEGSFGAAFALRSHDAAAADRLMALLAAGQQADGSYPYALRRDPINDIQTFPSLIAAAWNVLAWSGPGTPYRRVLWA